MCGKAVKKKAQQGKNRCWESPYGRLPQTFDKDSQWWGNAGKPKTMERRGGSIIGITRKKRGNAGVRDKRVVKAQKARGGTKTH